MIVLVIVVAVVGVAAVLLARTVQEAQAINAKAQNIATTGRGINEATDSVVQLNRTNELAESILNSARPLDTQLGRIVSTATGIDTRAASINSKAGSINSTAGSINSTAGSINTTAGTINANAGEINGAAGEINSSAGSINSTAGAINSSAGSIDTSAGEINSSAGRINTSAGEINDSAVGIDSLAASIIDTARKVDRDVELINTNLDVTLDLVATVKGDTGNILGQAGDANQTAACIDRKLFGQAGDDGDCQGQSQGGTPQSSQGVSATRQSDDDDDEPAEMLDKPPPVERNNKLEAPASGGSGGSRSQSSQPDRPAVTDRVTDRLPVDVDLRKLTPRQVNELVDDLVPGLLGGDRDPDERPPRDVLERLLPELPGLGR
ncbi:MAG: methyl-accepting chemotaxis protein [Solirubrobacteraceae bacterium MAG38_C4-C5]|nr:methyl-accepting chemotaxis protein [Candidatus Siliceabacter maunaloa]